MTGTLTEVRPLPRGDTALIRPRSGLPAAAIVLAVLLGPIAVLSPIPTVALVCAAALFVVVVRHPSVGAYTLFCATPLLVGVNRGSVLPVVRPHEALVLLVGAALAGRAVMRRVRGTGEASYRLAPLDVAIGALVVCGSLLPVLWMGARGHAPTPDDILYAFVLWKYAATYFVIRSAVRNVEDVGRCLWLSIAAAGFVAVLGILQALKLFGVPGFLSGYFAPDGLTDLLSNNRASSTIGNPMAFADVMVIHSAIAAAWLLRSRRHAGLLGAYAGLFCLAALASGQLSGVIALMVALGTLAVLTGQVKRLALAGVLVLMVAGFALRPVIERRLSSIDPATHLPQSWESRRENLRTYFLPDLSLPSAVLLGVRPAGRMPSEEPWRDWVYIESGFVWLLWTGGLPFVFAYVLFLSRGLSLASRLARDRPDVVGAAATGAVVGLAVVAFLMPLDPHLTLRGAADLTFGLLGIATSRAGVFKRASVES